MKITVIVITCLWVFILFSEATISNTEEDNLRIKIVKLNGQIEYLNKELEKNQSINDSLTTALNRAISSSSIYSRGTFENISEIIKILVAGVTVGLALLGLNIWKKQKKWEFQQFTVNSIIDSYSLLKTHVFYEKSLMDEFYEILESFSKSEEYNETALLGFVEIVKTKLMSHRESVLHN